MKPFGIRRLKNSTAAVQEGEKPRHVLEYGTQAAQ